MRKKRPRESITIDDISVFVQIAAAPDSSLTVVAEGQGLTQSRLSQILNKLECVLERDLYYFKALRDGTRCRRFTLTDDGEKVLPKFQGVIDAFNEI